MRKNIYNLIKSTGKRKYKYDHDTAETIGATILQAKDTMTNPVAAHFVLFTNYGFNTKAIAPRLNRVLKGKVKDLMYFWSVEQTYKQKFCQTVHIHLCLILDIPFGTDYDYLFRDIALTALQGLKNVDVEFNDCERSIVKRMWYPVQEGLPKAAWAAAFWLSLDPWRNTGLHWQVFIPCQNRP